MNAIITFKIFSMNATLNAVTQIYRNFEKVRKKKTKNRKKIKELVKSSFLWSRWGEFVVQIYLLSGALGFFECSLNAVRFLFCFSY